MRYAVLSDVHGNLEALSAVLADAAAEGALGILCLGDVVGYGADPNACVEILGERAARIVAGNHEHGALGLLNLDWFNSAARAAAPCEAAPPYPRLASASRAARRAAASRLPRAARAPRGAR